MINQFPEEFCKTFASLILIHEIRHRLQLLEHNLTILRISQKVLETFSIKQHCHGYESSQTEVRHGYL